MKLGRSTESPLTALRDWLGIGRFVAADVREGRRTGLSWTQSLESTTQELEAIARDAERIADLPEAQS